MLCNSCRNYEVPDDYEGPCPNCEQDVRGSVNARISADRVREMEELEEKGNIAGLRDYAIKFAANPVVATEANRRADALDLKSCVACDIQFRDENRYAEHLMKDHAFLRTKAEREAKSTRAA